MKKYILLFSLFFFVSAIFASNESLFNLNKTDVENQFLPLAGIEQNLFIGDMNINFQNSFGLNVFADLNLLNKIEIINLSGETQQGLPSVLTSLLLGPAGVATSNSTLFRAEHKLILLVVGTVVVIGATYFIIYATSHTTDACSTTGNNSACGDSCASSNANCCGNSCSGSSGSKSNCGMHGILDLIL